MVIFHSKLLNYQRVWTLPFSLRLGVAAALPARARCARLCGADAQWTGDAYWEVTFMGIIMVHNIG